MKVTIVSVGDLKEKYLVDGIKEYIKRLSKYTIIKEIVLVDEPIPYNSSNKIIDEIKKKEGTKILSHLNKKDYNIALDLKGEMLSSEELAKKISDTFTYKSSSLTFIIGGSLGLSKEVIDFVDFRLCFSKMTFPHQLMKLILLEQIYRSFKINNNEIYHK